VKTEPGIHLCQIEAKISGTEFYCMAFCGQICHAVNFVVCTTILCTFAAGCAVRWRTYPQQLLLYGTCSVSHWS